MVGKYYDGVKPKAAVDKAKVVRLRRQGMLFPDIATRMGLKPSRVAEICRELMTDAERAEILAKFGRDR